MDLIFGMWMYSDKLQIKFMFRSGPMIFGWVMALGLWNFAKYLVVTTFFRYMLGNIDLIFGIWVYNVWWVTVQLWNSFVILNLLLRELKKFETFASLLNIHGGDIRVIPTHLVFTCIYLLFLYGWCFLVSLRSNDLQQSLLSNQTFIPLSMIYWMLPV